MGEEFVNKISGYVFHTGFWLLLFLFVQIYLMIF